MTWEFFSDRMKQLCDLIRNAHRIDTEKPILIPGEPEAQIEGVRRVNGIPLEPKALKRLRGLVQGKYDYDIPRF